jgi:hypothetical protein
MSASRNNLSTESAPEILIKRLNTERTRKDIGSDTVYHVYFELSEHPQPEWRSIFEREWKGLKLTQEAGVEGSFLVVHCQLEEVAGTQLPALKKVVDATNEAYQQYAQKEATALLGREDAWRQERMDVDAMAAPLRFD